MNTNFNQIEAPYTHPDVREAMLPWIGRGYPWASGAEGVAADAALESARASVAQLVGAEPGELVLTSSGTEACNLAVKGLSWAAPKTRRTILASAVEHSPILLSSRFMERLGFTLALIPVDQDGRLHSHRLRELAGAETAAVAVQAASAEIGTVQDLEPAAAACRDHGIPLIVDATAAAGWIPLDVKTLGADVVAIASPALGGPPGAGALWIKPGTRILPLIHGGIQEGGRRGGEENLAAIAGMGKAAQLAPSGQAPAHHVASQLKQLLSSRIPDLRPTGSETHRLPRHFSCCIPGVEGEALVVSLADAYRISTGSVCSKGDMSSQSLKAIGIDSELGRGSLSLTWAPGADLEGLAQHLAAAVARLRSLAPAPGEPQ